jgi:hypothetical protein
MGMENATHSINLEPLHLYSLELAQRFNDLYWNMESENQEVLATLDEYREVRRQIKYLNEGLPYKPSEAHAIMQARPSSN